MIFDNLIDIKNLNIAEEVISMTSFIRKYLIYKRQHLSDRIININEIEFPYETIFHVYEGLNNVMFDNVDMTIYPFLTTTSFKPILTNQIEYKVPKEYGKLNIKYYINQKVNELNKFKINCKTIFNIKNSYKDILKEKRLRFATINYNPLSIINVIGTLDKQLIKFMIIMNTIFNNINELNKDNNVLIIPINQIYTKNELMKFINQTNLQLNKLRTGKFNIPISMFILDLVMYLLDKRYKNKYNIFDFLKKDSIDKLYLFFINDKKNEGTIVNLKTLKELIQENKQYLFKFIGLLNTIAYEKQLSDKEKELMIQNTDNDDIEDTNSLIKTINDKLTIKKLSQPSKTIEDNVNENVINEDESEIIKTIQNTLPNEPKVNDTYTEEEIIETTENVSKDTIPIVKEEINNSQKTNINELILNNIDYHIESQGLSIKQKERAKALFNRALNLEIKTDQGVLKVSDILNKKTDINVQSEEITPVKDKLLDKSLAKSNIFHIEKQYYDNVFYKDLISNLISLSGNGLFLRDYKEENELNTFNRIKHITVKFEDINGKRHTVKFKIPIPDENGVILVNGIQYYIRKQLVNLPICKISPTRVSLISNFNKTLIERKFHLGKSLIKSVNEAINKLEKDKDFKLEYKTGSEIYIDTKLPLDYTQLASQYKYIKNSKYTIHFNQNEIFDYFNIDDNKKKYIEEYCKQTNQTFIGMTNNKKNYLFMHNKTNIVSEIKNFGTRSLKVVNKGFISKFLFLDKESDYYKSPVEYCYLKILDKALPIIFILGFRYGLTNILKELNIKYRLVTKRSRLNLQPNEIAIKFNDFTLVFNRYPIFGSLILAGLSYFNLSKYNFGDLDKKDTYFQLLQDKGISINYLKGIDNFYNFFIDPITFDILKQMGEPTTPKGLMLRGVELLSDDYFKEPSSITNFRLRTLERIPSIIYNEISRQYAQYINDKKRDATFSINTESIFLRIMQDNSVVLYEDLNPIHDLKLKSIGTHLGFGGRTEEAFVEVDRKYPNDGIGVLSEATPDSGKVALNFNFPPQSNIDNIRGILKPIEDPNQADASQILSVTGLLLPGVVNDDPKRMNFINIQMTHVVPVKNYEIGRVRTGYETVVPYLVNDRFCIVAKDDGVIIDVNDKLKLFKVKYNNGKVITYDYGPKHGEAQGKYVYQELTITDKVQKGKKIKKFDILAYNNSYFDYDSFLQTQAWKNGVYTRIAFVENDITLEDADLITVNFANKLKYNSTHMRPITLTSDMVILEHKFIGDEVEYTTPLFNLSFRDLESLDLSTMEEENPELKDILTEFETVQTKAKFNGTITDIKVYYSCDKDQMDPSIRKFVNKVESYYKAKQKFAEGSVNEYDYNLPSKLEPGTRIKKKELLEDTILVQFYITHEDTMNSGDKLVVANQLKSVVSKVHPSPIYTEDGQEIGLLFASSSPFNRIVLSTFKVGIIETILDQLENEISEMI